MFKFVSSYFYKKFLHSPTVPAPDGRSYRCNAANDKLDIVIICFFTYPIFRMRKAFMFTLLGIGLSFGGIIVLYLYLNGLSESNNIILLITSLTLIAGSVYSFILANKPSKKISDDTHIVTDNGKNILEKNNALYNDYQKTANVRNRLQVMKSAADKNVI